MGLHAGFGGVYPNTCGWTEFSLEPTLVLLQELTTVR